MALVKVGSCNRCGKCCIRPYIDATPVIDEKEDRCKFYSDTSNVYLYGHCLIYGRGAKPIKNVKDRFGKTIADAQITWFEANCIDYPTALDKEVWNSFGGIYPPSGCSYNFQVVAEG